MKKITKFLIFISILGIFIFPSIFFAQTTPTLTTSDLTATSVTLNATGLTPTSIYMFEVSAYDASPILHFPSLEVTASSVGTASASFTILASKHYYQARIGVYDPSTGVVSNFSPYFNFKTESTTPTTSTPSLTTSDLTATSVTLNATGLTPNQIYKFKINGDSGFIEQQFTADSNGTGEVSFGPPNFHLEVYSDFVASVSEYNPNTGISSNAIATLNFKTLGPNLFVSDITATSVTLNATGLTPSRLHKFEVIGASGSPAQEVTSDVNSNAKATFNNLVSGHNYTARVSLIGSETTFNGSFSVYFTTLALNTDNNSNNNTNTNTNTNNTNSNSSTTTTSTSTTVGSGGNLVPCNTTANPTACGFNDLLTLINNVVHFILFDMVVPIAAIMFAYAGILLIFSGGDTSKRSKAKSIFINVAIGFIIAVAAWLIVEFVLNLLGYNQAFNWFGF